MKFILPLIILFISCSVKTTTVQPYRGPVVEIKKIKLGKKTIIETRRRKKE